MSKIDLTPPLDLITLKIDYVQTKRVSKAQFIFHIAALILKIDQRHETLPNYVRLSQSRVLSAVPERSDIAHIRWM